MSKEEQDLQLARLEMAQIEEASRQAMLADELTEFELSEDDAEQYYTEQDKMI